MDVGCEAGPVVDVADKPIACFVPRIIEVASRSVARYSSQFTWLRTTRFRALMFDSIDFVSTASSLRLCFSSCRERITVSAASGEIRGSDGPLLISNRR